METQLSSSSSSPSCWYCYGKCWWRKSQMKMKRGKQTHTQANNATLQPKQLMLCCLLCMLIAVLCCQCLSVICISAYQLHLIFFRQGTLLFIIIHYLQCCYIYYVFASNSNISHDFIYNFNSGTLSFSLFVFR